MDNLYLIVNFCRKTNPSDHEYISLTRFFLQKNLQLLNCVLFYNEHKVPNQYMKEMLSKAFDRKQTTRNISNTSKY